MQNIIVTSLLWILLLPSAVLAQRPLPPFKKFVHQSNRDTLPYSLLEPIKVSTGEKYPLVIFLHGAGERGNDNDRHLAHIKILFNYNVLDKYPSFVLAPQCPSKETWSELMHGRPLNAAPTRPMKMLLEVLDKVLAAYPIDPSRIYVTGVSMGGFGTWDLIARFPNRFAAAVPVCGGGDERTAEKIKHIPIWAFHGAEDEVVPARLSRQMITALQNAGARPGYTEFPDVKHSSWHQAYKDPHMIRWLWKQKLQ